MGCYRTENVGNAEEMYVHSLIFGYEICILARRKKTFLSLSTEIG